MSGTAAVRGVSSTHPTLSLLAYMGLQALRVFALCPATEHFMPAILTPATCSREPCGGTILTSDTEMSGTSRSLTSPSERLQITVLAD